MVILCYRAFIIDVMCNFRDTTDLKHDCTSCKSFTSYAVEYEDDLEPYELGRCDKDIAEMVGEEMVCDLWDSRFLNAL